MHLKTSNRTVSRAKPVTVHFPLPRSAVSKLRALAVGKDPRLLDLGVLAVQISDDESIVLGIELDKAKKKSPVYINKANPSSFTHSSHERVNSNTKPTDTRAFTTTSTFGLTSCNYKGIYTSQHLSTARNDNFVSKAKKPAQDAKRRAKESLNAAKRGRGRGRVGKITGRQKASVRASTWEMVYSHIGLPGEHRNKASNLLEPPVGSQASGIAHVPVAQTELPKESTSKTDSKRKSLASSPPLKSPNRGAVHSEDDSSVSSSPCSHSPMNSEELMNLFVDSSFSATSVLKQLAEIRSKEEENQTDFENDSDISVANSSCEAGTDDQAKVNEPVISTNILDSQCQWGVFPKNSGTSSLNLENDHTTNLNIKKPVKGVVPKVGKLNTSFTSTTDSLIGNPTSIKRPASSSGEQNNIGTTSSLSSTTPNVHNQPPKRAKTELDKLSQENEVNPSKPPDSLTLPANVTQQPKQLGVPNSFPPNNKFSNLSATVTTANVALRNFRQYGYYYSSEELNRALAKTPSLKNKGTPQQSLYTSASSSSKLYLSTLDNGSGTSTLLKSKPQDLLPALKVPGPNLLLTSSLSKDNSSFENSQDDLPKIKAVSSDIPKVDKSTNDLNENSPSNSTEIMSKKGQCEVSYPIMASSTSAMPTITATTSSKVLTSSDSLSHSDTVVDTNNSQKSGKCYAISYVYPLGTVWYPYVAITPYAVLQKNANESGDTGKEEKESEVAEKSGYNISSQYIDLASSLRYWQQLSLLYKNQMLVTASANHNVLGQRVAQNTGTNAPGFSSTQTTSISSNLSNQSLPFSVMDSKSERADPSFSLSDSCTDTSSLLHKQASQALPSNSNGFLEKKPVRRPSVIVAAKVPSTTNEESSQHKLSHSTPDSDSSTEGMQMKPEGLVIDNCNRLIEEHCHRMNQVLAETPGNHNGSHTGSTKCNPNTPLLSFIPDSSIAYVNVGNNNGLKKTVLSGKDGKSKLSKKKKSNKTL